MSRPKRSETGPLALNTGVAEPIAIQEPPVRASGTRAEFDSPQSEPGPVSLTVSATGHRGPPQLEEGDILNGVKEIHGYVCRLLGREQSISSTYWQISRGILPARKYGRYYIGSRRGIAQHLARGLGFAA